MREIITNSQARDVRNLGFCYLCGENFDGAGQKTRDHVPPKGVFRIEDRDWPLILPACHRCNQQYSYLDQQAMDLIHLLHPERSRKFPTGTEEAGIGLRNGWPVAVLMRGLRPRPVITKIIKACHTALYAMVLPSETRHNLQLPFPEFDPQTGRPVTPTFYPSPHLICKILKDNRRIRNVDRIHAYNGKFKFEAVWSKSDCGRETWAAFAIDLYDWHLLANDVLGHPQWCVGFYMIGNQPLPPDTSVAPAIELGFTWTQPLNPFEE